MTQFSIGLSKSPLASPNEDILKYTRSYNGRNHMVPWVVQMSVFHTILTSHVLTWPTAHTQPILRLSGLFALTLDVACIPRLRDRGGQYRGLGAHHAAALARARCGGEQPRE